MTLHISAPPRPFDGRAIYPSVESDFDDNDSYLLRIEAEISSTGSFRSGVDGTDRDPEYPENDVDVK